MKLNIGLNQRGNTTVNGQTITHNPDAIPFGSGHTWGSADLHTENHLNPLFEMEVREVAEEVEQMRLAKVLRPFVEGEMIGVLPRRVRKKPLTEKQRRTNHARRMEMQRDEMLLLRSRNNNLMEELVNER